MNHFSFINVTVPHLKSLLDLGIWLCFIRQHCGWHAVVPTKAPHGNYGVLPTCKKATVASSKTARNMWKSQRLSQYLYRLKLTLHIDLAKFEAPVSLRDSYGFLPQQSTKVSLRR